MWWTSVRSIVTVLVAATFCYLAAISKVEAKDFLVVVILVFNFYYLNKVRNGGSQNGKDPTNTPIS
jgi:hypothetical protein